MGRRQDNALKSNPEIARAYELYTICRRRNMVVVTVGKGSKGESSTKILPFVDGLSVLPLAGGVLDQPYRLMTFFQYFEDGEQEAFSNRLR